jgi:hypothetical protein
VPEHRRHRWHSWLALGAAYLVVIQALLAGLSIGVSAAPNGVEPAGFVICSQRDMQPPAADGPGREPARQHGANCCVLGCDMFGPSVAPPPAIAASLALQTFARPAAMAIYRYRVNARLERTPRNPRAPPPST